MSSISLIIFYIRQKKTRAISIDMVEINTSLLMFHVNLSLFCTSKPSKVLINEKAKVFRDVAEGTTCHILYRLHVKLENFADFLFQLFTQLACPESTIKPITFRVSSTELVSLILKGIP